ncbi:MAG: aminoacyl-histidine dipeptidase [Acidobacteriota bacterium]|nr:aminoacyl-histidine dipeptidase [Acidobacteriota bacterium]
MQASDSSPPSSSGDGAVGFDPDPDLSVLEPRPLWRAFDQLRRIPRPSKHEEKVRAWVLQVAADHGCETRTDEAGNVVIRVPATAGFEDAPTVVIQGHLDMVCEKNADTEFNFFEDPIRLRLEGDILTAQGTTLGADNGVAIAAGLGLLGDDSVRHGPLELLFTLDEETGLNGVKALDPSIVTGRLLLNLDAEEEGLFVIGSAGARSAVVRLPLERSAAAGGSAFRIAVAGATGGHSGADIHLGRANAIRALAEILERLPDSVAVAEVAGGSAPNVIPREAAAVVVGERSAVAPVVEAASAELRQRHADTDPGLRVELRPVDVPEQVLTSGTARALVTLLHRLHHGVRVMSPVLEGLVQASSNLATVRLDAETAEIHCSNRSSVAEDLDAAVAEITEQAREAGAEVTTTRGYPGWQADPSSNLVQLAVEVYQRLYGRNPEVTGVHGGLECGILGEKIPGLEMLSFGPDIRNPHSPDEEVSVSSVRRVLGEYLPLLLAALAQPSAATPIEGS